jgi:hypothetical protein
LENARTAHDVVVKDRAEVLIKERVKLQRFQDSICKKLAELRRDTEASMAVGEASSSPPMPLCLISLSGSGRRSQ